MKIGFLHLSDMHLSKRIENGSIINKIVDCLEYYHDLDELFLILSGDLSDRGSEENYKIVKKTIGELLSCLGKRMNKRVHFLCVPGNHDISLKPDGRNHDIISNYYKENKIDEYAVEEIKCMHAFFKYANYKSLFVDNEWIDKKTYCFDKIRISFNLINTAPFSTLGHFDKELHYMPLNIVDGISHNNCDYSITVMHHSFEWFNEMVKIPFEDKVNNTSELLFLGHEHNESMIDRKYKGKETVISKGGQLDVYNMSGTINFLVLDTSNNTCQASIYEYNKKENMFLRITSETSKIKLKNRIAISEEFIHDINVDYTLGKNDFNDYFVFPRLDIIESQNSKKSKMLTIDEFENAIKDKRIVVLKAKDGIGKTTFLKYLFSHYSCNKCPLFMNQENVAVRLKLNKAIKRLVEEQYDETNAYDKYVQQELKNKILLIDDFDYFKFRLSASDLYDQFNGIFGQIIMTVNEDNWLNLEEQFKDEYSESIITMRIEPFVYTKRQELINKMMCAEEITLDRQKSISDKVNKAYDGLDYIRNTSTDFLIRFINYIIKNETADILQYENIFSIVFESNIQNQIIAKSEKDAVDKYWKVLILIAKEMHQRRTYFINIQTIVGIITTYSAEYTRVDSTKFLKMINDTNIMKCINDNYYFGNRVYLSFFVAKYISEELSNYNKDPYLELIDNIYFANNSEIVLFVIYLFQNKGIVEDLFSCAEKAMCDWEEFSIENLNINMFSKNKKIIFNTIIEPDDEIVSGVKEEVELQFVEKSRLDCEVVYNRVDDDKYSTNNRILSSIKYTELIARIIPIFSTIIPASLRLKMINALFSYVNKLIYIILKPIDENFDRITNELHLSLLDRNNDGDMESIRQGLMMFSMLLVMSIYDLFAKCVVNKESRNLLKQVETKDLSNILFVLSIYIYSNNENQLVNYLNEKCCKNNIIFNNIVLLSVYKHLIMDSISKKEKDRIVSTLSNLFNINTIRLKKDILKYEEFDLVDSK